MIKAENLHKTYKDGKITLEVLKGIDLEINKNEILCIIGPSGAGKSTLLHLLGGLDTPSQGRVIFEEEDFYALAETRKAQLRNRKIGFVFQFYHLLPEFTALENVMLPALVNKTVPLQAKAKAQGLLEQVGLKQRMKHKPAQLSGGEQQRVAIARALVNDPQVIFCDEPTGNLDSERGKEVVALLIGLKQEKHKTLVIVSHDEEIARKADRIVHIRDGRIVETQNFASLRNEEIL